MNFGDLLKARKRGFQQKFIEALARKNSCTAEQAESEFKNFIEVEHI